MIDDKNERNLDRNKIHSLVETFYQSGFKTFYINSVDSETFIKPIGVFVSLGITTSLKILEDIKELIKSRSEGEYDAILAEISSKKISGQYMNSIIFTGHPQQYIIENLPETVMNEEESRKELERIRSIMNPKESVEVLKKYAPRVSRLKDLIEKLTTTQGWDSHLIQKENEEYKIFHRFINYKKVDDVEYRVGIFVTKKENNNEE